MLSEGGIGGRGDESDRSEEGDVVFWESGGRTSRAMRFK